ncbi:hypothetical protein F5884DRAFT_229903 [Xylogone sp. PMI_703]|nr:hypothetical protein F5884DRAFT_229903 [Xylogone sp. PMI_703]
MQEIKSAIKDIAYDQKQQQMFKWLSPLNPSARHSENQKKRAKGTGRWLIDGPIFAEWSSGRAEFETLCCYGDPGVGKTIISSFAIDKLREYMASESKVGMAYIYCDYRDQEKQTTENILGEIVKQLLKLLPSIPEPLLKLYEELIGQEKPLSSTDAIRFLNILSNQSDKIYVCFDAVDEMKDLRSILTELQGRPSSLRMFITGRPHVQETVQKYLSREKSIYIKAQDTDIQQFVTQEIGGPYDIEPDAMDEMLRIEILDKVVKAAQGDISPTCVANSDCSPGYNST